MMKRLMAVILTVVMVASLGMVAFADDGSVSPTNVKEALYALGADKGLSGTAIETWLTRSIDVSADVEVKESGTGTWKDGPVTITEKKVDNIPTFDFKATIYMDVVKKEFNKYIEGAKLAISLKGGSNETALLNELENMPVSGSFEIIVEVPEGLVIPDSIINGSNMEGFNDEAKTIFHEDSRNYSDNKLTIVVGVGGTATNADTYATKAELDSYLGSDLVLTCEGIQPEAFGTYQMKGLFNGQTVIGDSIATVNYSSTPLGDEHNPDKMVKPYASATITIKKSSHTGTSTGSNTSDEAEVEFIVDGKVMRTVKGREPFTIDISEIIPEEKEGFEFEGWYLDKELTKKASDSITITKDTELYAKWKVKSGPGPVLNMDDHFAYIIGYPDGTVKPLNNIDREEVATIFFRLLTEEAGEALNREIAPYSDVEATKWSSTAIATLSNGNYITGYEDGTFKPDQSITRAEFATIAARFSGDTNGGGVELNDIAGHWAENYIKVCTANGWIVGYEDGSFKPDQPITRAEAMAIVNRMLNRAIDAESIKAVADDIYYFVDNNVSDWSYYAVLEATNSHDYDRAEGETYETWTKVTEIRDWVTYEK